MTRAEVEQVAQLSSELRSLFDSIQNNLMMTDYHHDEGDILGLLSEIVGDIDLLDGHSRFLDDTEFANSIRKKTPQPAT